MFFDALLWVIFIISGLLSIYYLVIRHDADEKKQKKIDSWLGIFPEVCLFSGAIGLFRLFYRIFPSTSPDTVFLILTSLALIVYLFYVYRKQTEETIKNRKTVRDIFFCLLFVFLLRGFFYDYFYIPSKSMLPTLTVGDLVLTDKKAYGYRVPAFHNYLSKGREPERGEIIVFRKPGAEIFYIKRIVAVPGDTLHYSEQKQLSINGVPLATTDTNETYENIPHFKENFDAGWHSILVENGINLMYITPAIDSCYLTQVEKGNTLTCTIPEDNYFVLGDNRDHSNDSRFWGFVPKDRIVGPAKVILFNFNGVSRFFKSLALKSE